MTSTRIGLAVRFGLLIAGLLLVGTTAHADETQSSPHKANPPVNAKSIQGIWYFSGGGAVNIPGLTTGGNCSHSNAGSNIFEDVDGDGVGHACVASNTEFDGSDCPTLKAFEGTPALFGGPYYLGKHSVAIADLQFAGTAVPAILMFDTKGEKAAVSCQNVDLHTECTAAGVPFRCCTGPGAGCVLPASGAGGDFGFKCHESLFKVSKALKSCSTSTAPTATSCSSDGDCTAPAKCSGKGLLPDPGCVWKEADCNDKYDNDNDGLVDCADPDCSGVDGCP